MKPRPIYLAGAFELTDNIVPVVNPFNGLPVAQVCQADEKILNEAIEAAVRCKSEYKSWSSLKIYKALLKISAALELQEERFVQTIIDESGKPRMYAKSEVQRAVETFRFAAMESTRLPHQLLSLDDAASGAGLMGRVQYTSAGIVAGISPFNFPLNLVAHKVAPAIATKSPILLKPSSKTPLTALLLAEIIDSCDLPKGAFSVLPCTRKLGYALVEDPRIQVLSFTGSAEVGWELKARAGKKKVVLELGGNAAAIVHEDADYDAALNECLIGAFAYSGQVCIHTQRIYVHKALFDHFVADFVVKALEITNQDPNLDSCRMSVMIDESNAMRVEDWVTEAVQQGAELLCGGVRTGSYISPTVLTRTRSGMKVHDEEVFGPVVCINSYTSIDEAVHYVNDSKFGLQAAVFTRDQGIIEKAYAQIEVGGVIINRATTFRTDQMPYGGIKDSGFGREGIRYAMMDFLEPKLLVF
jgi:glyceraldehyde-3-phosphate dehydrogenase (NADP+)